MSYCYDECPAVYKVDLVGTGQKTVLYGQYCTVQHSEYIKYYFVRIAVLFCVCSIVSHSTTPLS